MSYLHHQQERVEDDQSHDEIFERRRNDHAPNFIFETVAIFGHVAFQRLGLDREIDAGFLRREMTVELWSNARAKKQVT